MRPKNQARNGNVDKTRSTLQKTVNRRTKLAQDFLRAATNRHAQVRRLNGFISQLINEGTITSARVKEFFTKNQTINHGTN